MVSLRFPFSFSQPAKPNISRPPASSRNFPAGATITFAGVAVAVAAGATAYTAYRDPHHPFFQNALNLLFSAHCSSSSAWASLSFADSSTPVVEPKTGASFPSVIDGSRKLLGLGLRKKSVLGLKNIDVYAFGVYANGTDLKDLLKEKYGKISTSDLKENNEFNKDIMENDISITIRLQIVYGRLSIGSVRSAFEDSVGRRLQKFGEGDNKELLQRFTSQFKDEYKIPRGSVIDLSRDRGYVLRTTIDGKEVGSIESKLLCKSILDLYIGEDPFDKKAKEDVKSSLASLLQD